MSTCRCLFCAGIRTKRSLADYGDDYDDFNTQIGTTNFFFLKFAGLVFWSYNFHKDKMKPLIFYVRKLVQNLDRFLSIAQKSYLIKWQLIIIFFDYR